MNTKISLLALLVALPFSTFAKSELTIEQRFEQLEKRLQIAEQRANKAEAEIAKIKKTPAPASTHSDDTQQASVSKNAIAAAPVQHAEPATKSVSSFLSTGKDVELKFYGDVEYNMDVASKKGQLTSVRSSSDKNAKPGDRDRWDVNGRILLGFDGIQHGKNNHYAGVTVQPLADMQGRMNLDDAAFFFGRTNDWSFKVGRYEAYDMFPLNQDTFVEYSGNTANDLYGDGYGYIYMMKEGRGRTNNGGSFLLSKNIDNWYFELNNLVEDGSSLFIDSQYHGYDLKNKKNVIYMRPVVAYREGPWSVAAAVEKNVINNAYGYYQNDKFVDQSKRTGYGLTGSWNTLKNDPLNGAQINLNTAYLDAPAEKDFSAGINGLWKRFELGYIYAHNNIKSYNAPEALQCGDVDGSCLVASPGNYSIHTLHASYQFPNVLDMPNFNIYLGAYASYIDTNALHNGENKDRYGSRLRFKYFF